MTQTSLSTFLLAGPEFTLVAAALVAYLGGAFCGLRQGWLVALIGIVVAACWPGMGLEAGAVVTSGPLSIDDFSLFVRRFVLVAGAGGMAAEHVLPLRSCASTGEGDDERPRPRLHHLRR